MLSAHGEPCCPPCILSDTHQLVLSHTAGLGDRVAELERQVTDLTVKLSTVDSGLSARMNIVERCLEDIERIFRLKRKRRPGSEGPVIKDPD
jgi:hypothetical protein